MDKRRQAKKHRKELERKAHRKAARLYRQGMFARESYLERAMRTGRF